MDLLDGRLVDRGDLRLVEIGSSGHVELAHRQESRLFPLVGDVNGDGLPDIVLADQLPGRASRAFLDVMQGARKPL